jgi:hypothetical protein
MRWHYPSILAVDAYNRGLDKEFLRRRSPLWVEIAEKSTKREIFAGNRMAPGSAANKSPIVPERCRFVESIQSDARYVWKRSRSRYFLDGKESIHVAFQALQLRSLQSSCRAFEIFLVVGQGHNPWQDMAFTQLAATEASMGM